MWIYVLKTSSLEDLIMLLANGRCSIIQFLIVPNSVHLEINLEFATAVTVRAVVKSPDFTLRLFLIFEETNNVNNSFHEFL